MIRTTAAVNIMAILIIATTSVLFGCVNSNRQITERLMVNYSSGTNGELFPCGCRIPLGGLSRRAGIFAQESPYPQCTVDAGSFAGGNTAYDRFVAGWILQAYGMMDYKAVNLGVREASIPVTQLREWDQQTGGILISVNLVDENDLPVTRRSLIREVGGLKIGITGVTSEGPEVAEATELPVVIDPVEPLKEVLAEFDESGVDLVILLADMVDERINNLLSQVSGFDLIVQGRDFTPAPVTHSTVLDDGTRVVKSGDSGKHVGRIRLDFDGNGEIVRDEVILIALDSASPTRSDISVLLTDFRKELQDRRDEFLGDPTNPFERLRSPEMVDVLSGFTGPGMCNSCHLLYGQEMQAVGHSYAWANLGDENSMNPECLKCHTTGYGYPTGMQDPYRDEQLTGVTCESCHGPAAQHVREQYIISKDLDPSAMIPPIDPTGLPFTREVPEAICRGCHTPEWSPNFDYATWVERVKHHAAEEALRNANPETGEADPE
ncbi:MAG: multiheme c-type cytochrome [bacterium]|nr:multiheme c-type cytochrome [bacterium]